MAPELLRSARGAAYTERCDVYSCGILANEVLTQTIPYSDAQTEQVKLQTILEARCSAVPTPLLSRHPSSPLTPPLPSPLAPHPSLLTLRSSPLHPPPLPTRYNYEQLTAAIATDGLRPCQPEADAFPPALLELTRRCWAEDVQRRPRASEAHAEIAELLRTAGGGGEGGEGEGGDGLVVFAGGDGGGGILWPGNDVKAFTLASMKHSETRSTDIFIVLQISAGPPRPGLRSRR